MNSRSKRGWRAHHRHAAGRICPIQHPSRAKPVRDPETARKMAVIRERGPRSPGNLLHAYKEYMKTPYVEGVDSVKLVEQ